MLVSSERWKFNLSDDSIFNFIRFHFMVSIWCWSLYLLFIMAIRPPCSSWVCGCRKFFLVGNGTKMDFTWEKKPLDQSEASLCGTKITQTFNFLKFVRFMQQFKPLSRNFFLNDFTSLQTRVHLLQGLHILSSSS